MSELADLYQEVIIDHSKKPRNFRKLEGASHTAVGHNPLCGDRLTLYVRLEGDRIAEIGFQGNGCAISSASASLMTDSVRGLTRAQAGELFERFHAMVTAALDAPAGGPELGKLQALSGVREFPMRVKCATLAWHTLRAAIEGSGEPVTTE